MAGIKSDWLIIHQVTPYAVTETTQKIWTWFIHNVYDLDTDKFPVR